MYAAVVVILVQGNYVKLNIFNVTYIAISIIEFLFRKTADFAEKLQVKLPSGTVEGFYKKSVNDKDYISFEGIPYAQPPIGDNRFKVNINMILLHKSIYVSLLGTTTC